MRAHAIHRLAALLTVALLTGTRAAEAQTPGAGQAVTFGAVSSNIAVSSSGYNNLISIVCWVGGAGLGVTALFKIKAHVDNPGQAPLKDGLIRLGCGGALLAFPFIQQTMQGSISNGSLSRLAASVLIMDNSVAYQ